MSDFTGTKTSASGGDLKPAMEVAPSRIAVKPGLRWPLRVRAGRRHAVIVMLPVAPFSAGHAVERFGLRNNVPHRNRIV
ncbi:hypothetical protein [Ensifer sp. B1-9]|uniref:hypothetical protein n=1 Tax=Ensifer sp. B1-9 TaxID=3141455 RepID=UPI003D1DF1ED